MKSKNGETTLADVVKSIHDLTRSMNAGFAKQAREIREVRHSVDRLSGRFDNFLRTSGGRSVDHERRISKLEHDVAQLKSA